MFESTLPMGTPDLMRVSGFRRYLDEVAVRSRAGAASTRLSSLSPSLLDDLLRFERNGSGSELLEVLAASLRHGRDLLIHLELEGRVIPLTVFPGDRLAHCPLPPAQLLEARLNALGVMHVEPALFKPPGHGKRSWVNDRTQYCPLGTLTWELALRGARDALLPELSGSAAYRVTPGADLRALNLTGSMAAAVARLRRETTNLREITHWPGFDRERGMRLLNALYLQSALIVSRTHPAATNEGWASGSLPF